MAEGKGVEDEEEEIDSGGESEGADGEGVVEGVKRMKEEEWLVGE